MRLWHDFLDSLDSDGGKIFLLMVLMAVGFTGVAAGVPEGRDIIIGSFGALLMTLKDSGSNKDRREGDPMPLPTIAGAPSVLSAPGPTLPSGAEVVNVDAETVNVDKVP